jgi:uncharacterized RDD family membrane protein YckC
LSTRSERQVTLARRLLAILYDGLLVFALMCLATLPFIAVRGGEPVSPNTLLYQLSMLCIPWAFFCGFWTLAGRTLGMQSWSLQLETADGRRPNLAEASIRFVAAILSWLPLGLGFWWLLWDREHLAWHDRLSGTRLRWRPRD